MIKETLIDRVVEALKNDCGAMFIGIRLAKLKESVVRVSIVVGD